MNQKVKEIVEKIDQTIQIYDPDRVLDWKKAYQAFWGDMVHLIHVLEAAMNE